MSLPYIYVKLNKMLQGLNGNLIEVSPKII
jgi:hypothetical protein